MTINIRPESESDYAAIYQLTEEAFKGKPYAGGDEQDLIDALRAIRALSVSLVATDDSVVVGQITFSPATITSRLGTWFALGPVSVSPERQGEGIGGELIEAGIKRIKAMGAWGCILTGDPRYYSRHGFEMAQQHCPVNEPSEYFMLRLLGNKQPQGIFEFHEAFYPSRSAAEPG